MATNLRFLGATGPTSGSAAPAFTAPGSDVIVLRLSEDYYLGDAQFTVSIDGTLVGDTFSAQASRGAGLTQDFAFAGILGAGPHAVTVNFLNDAFSSNGDRNLIVERVFLNNAIVPGQGAIQYGPGAADYALPATTTTPPASTDTLLLRMSQDFYVENAQFIVRVDGVQQGGINTVTVQRGDIQDFTFAGDFGNGAHRVSVEFLNDRFDANGDSNLIVEQARFNGVVIPDAPAIQFGPGPREFATPASADPGTTTPPPATTGPDALVLRMSQDFYVENAQFVVNVDGVQQGGVNTVGVPRGQIQDFTFRGDFGDGAHRVAVTFLNDRFDANGDSNLIVEGATFNGVAIADAPAIQFGTTPREFATPASADPGGAPQPIAPVLLSDVANGVGGFRILAENGIESLGRFVDGMGDINGDGFADVVIGSPNNGPSFSPVFSVQYRGAAYVVFGSADGGSVDLRDVAAGNASLGIKIAGDTGASAAGGALDGAGDVNGDGHADFLLDSSVVVFSSSRGTPTPGSITESAYVVFGREDGNYPTQAELAAGTGGFQVFKGVIDTPAGSGQGISQLSGVGDVSGDGLSDVAMIVRNFSGTLSASTTSAYVVFGKTSGSPVAAGDLTSTGSGFSLVAEQPSSEAGRGAEFTDIANAGDVNGDGLSDIVVRTSYFDDRGQPYDGSAYVVFGKTDGASVNLGDLGTAGGPGGFKIRPGAGDSIGTSAGAGDVNGDGLADIIVSSTGSAYVLFGKNSNAEINLGDLAQGTSSAGFKIVGSRLGGVETAGDVNGDGLSDLLVGANIGTTNNGAVLVVFGKADGASLNVDGIVSGTSTAGFAILGENPDDLAFLGKPAGDVNGDGYSDLLVGATGVDRGGPSGEFANGAVYVVYGRADWHV